MRRSLVDVATGRPLEHSYDGRPVAFRLHRNGRSDLLIDPTRFQRLAAGLPLRMAKRLRALLRGRS